MKRTIHNWKRATQRNTKSATGWNRDIVKAMRKHRQSLLVAKLGSGEFAHVGV